MAQDDAEQRAAELHPADPSATPPSLPAPPQALLVPPPTGSPGAPSGPQPGQPFLRPTLGSPLARPPGPAAVWAAGPRSNLQRLVDFLRSVLFIGGIGALAYGGFVGAKMHRVSSAGHSARCGSVFKTALGHDAFHQYGGGSDLRAACADQIAKVQTLTWGLLGLGVLLILASFVFLVISWTMKWRRGWRPWRTRFYGSP